MAGPQRPATRSRRSATFSSASGGADEGGVVEQREQGGEQGPQDAGAGGSEGFGRLVGGGRHQRTGRACRTPPRSGCRRGPPLRRAPAPVRLLDQEFEAWFAAVGGGDQQDVHRARPAGQFPAEGAGRAARRRLGEQPGDGAAGSGEGAEQFGDAGGGQAWRRSGRRAGGRPASVPRSRFPWRAGLRYAHGRPPPRRPGAARDWARRGRAPLVVEQRFVDMGRQPPDRLVCCRRSMRLCGACRRWGV